MDKLHIYQNDRYVASRLITMSLEIQKHDMSDLCFIGILKGGIYTFSKLMNLIPFEDDGPVFGYLGLSSYGGNMQSGSEMKVTYDFDLTEEMLCDKNVWVIDDCSDTGRTLEYARALIMGYNPKSIRTAVLVDKKIMREANHSVKPDVVGFVYEKNEFLVGCGLGYGEKYRHLRMLCELEITDG